MQALNSGKNLAGITLLWQFLLVIVFGLIFYISYDTARAISVLIGGLICVFTSAVYAFFSFKISGGSKYILVYKNIKSGRKAKLSLSIILLLIFFNVPQVRDIDLVIGFCVALFMHYPIMYISHRVKGLTG